MGLLDKFNTTLQQGFNDPIAMGLLAYGMTGQGNDPAGAAMSAMMQASQAKAKADELARQKAQQAQIASMFANNTIDPATLANYSMGGGEGAKDLLNTWQFMRTPQSVAPGQMMIDPTTNKMSMPAPKMGEGQMWDGKQVSSAPGYLQAYGAQKAVDAKTAIDQFAGEQKIGYGYDAAMAGLQSGLRMGENQAQQAYGAKLDPMQTYDQASGGMVYNNRFDIAGGGAGGSGYMAERPSGEKIMGDERAKRLSTSESGMLDAAKQAAVLQGNLNQLSGLNITTGSGQEWIDSARGIASRIGIDVGNLDNNQVAQGIIARMVASLPKNGGDMSNYEIQQRLQQLPQMSQTKEGFAKSIDMLSEYADMQQLAAEEIRNAGGLTPELEQAISNMFSKWGQ